MIFGRAKRKGRIMENVIKNDNIIRTLGKAKRKYVTILTDDEASDEQIRNNFREVGVKKGFDAAE